MRSHRAGTVESRIRQLVMKLEFVDSLILAHPFVKGFDQISYCVTEEEVLAVAQGDISDVISSRKKEDMEGKEGVSPVYSTTFYIGLQIEDKPGKILFLQYDCVDPFLSFFKLVLLVHDGLTSRIPQRNSLSLLKCGRSSMKLLWELSCDISKGWISQNCTDNSKRVISRSGLPDNVFDPGERPAKLVQKRVKVGFLLEDEADNLDRSLNSVKQGSGQVKQHITRYAKQTPTVCPYELVWITGRYIVLLIFLFFTGLLNQRQTGLSS